MPLYEYKCNECGKTFEVIQRFSDQPLKVHEGCGGAVQRLISAPAFHFKGSGWYVTDYAHGSNGSAKPKTETSPKTEAKKPSPAAKTESSSPATTASK